MTITIIDEDINEAPVLQMQVPSFDIFTGIPAILTAIASAATAKPKAERKPRKKRTPSTPATATPAPSKVVGTAGNATVAA